MAPDMARRWGRSGERNSKLKKAGFEGVTGFSLVSTCANDGVPSYDNALNAILSLESGYFVAEARSSIVPLTTTMWLSFANGAIEIMKPAYGIGYMRESHLGPFWYAVGASQGLGRDDYLES